VDLRTDLIQVLDERIVEAERELNRLRRDLGAALQADVSDDEIEQHSAAVQACERRVDRLYIDRLAVLRAGSRRWQG
jgi:NAD(P)-dependent dehydrogenase (short-subunit alcohol dehydrogenase family)